MKRLSDAKVYTMIISPSLDGSTFVLDHLINALPPSVPIRNAPAISADFGRRRKALLPKKIVPILKLRSRDRSFPPYPKFVQHGMTSK
ncbi:hypothetical protein J6590_092284, partial [Homalodisca vitripennis]